MEESLEEFDEFSYEIELEKNFYIKCWDDTDVKGLLSLDDETFDYYLQRAKKQALLNNWKKSLLFNIIEKQDEIEFTSIGLYLFIKLNYESNSNGFDKYISYFENLAINDLLRYNGLKSNQKIKRSKNSTYDFEKQGEFNAKKFDTQLKVPNLEIEDKTHLFYGKKIVITGTFNAFEKRSEMAEMIKEVGGDNNTAISKLTDFVIVGNDAGPKKLQQIESLNIKTLNEKEFLNLFNL